MGSSLVGETPSDPAPSEVGAQSDSVGQGSVRPHPPVRVYSDAVWEIADRNPTHPPYLTTPLRYIYMRISILTHRNTKGVSSLKREPGSPIFVVFLSEILSR